MSEYDRAYKRNLDWYKDEEKAKAFMEHDFDPKRPWDYVFSKVLKDTDWWLNQFELPLLRDSTVRTPPAIEGDVQIAKALPPEKRTSAPATDYTGVSGGQVVQQPKP